MNGKSFIATLLLTLFVWGAPGAFADGLDARTDSQQTERVDINTADAETLERMLKGIGRSRAEAIVAYRQANGKFYSPEELTAVKGIGSSTVERNADRILIE